MRQKRLQHHRGQVAAVTVAAASQGRANHRHDEQRDTRARGRDLPRNSARRATRGRRRRPSRGRTPRHRRRRGCPHTPARSGRAAAPPGRARGPRRAWQRTPPGRRQRGRAQRRAPRGHPCTQRGPRGTAGWPRRDRGSPACTPPPRPRCCPGGSTPLRGRASSATPCRSQVPRKRPSRGTRCTCACSGTANCPGARRRWTRRWGELVCARHASHAGALKVDE